MNRVINRLRAGFAALGITFPKLRTAFKTWRNRDQEFELNFHKTNQFRQSAAFDEETRLLFTDFGFSPDQFAGKVIVDIGAGSKLRGTFFKDSRIAVVEPLASRFLQEISWCDLHKAEQIFSEPAEKFIDELEGKADFVFSINVLDHCYDFEQIVKNIYQYLSPSGLAFLSFDSHHKTSEGHPLVLTKPICEKVFVKAGFHILKSQVGFSPDYFQIRRRNGYNDRSDCINFWLTK